MVHHRSNGTKSAKILEMALDNVRATALKVIVLDILFV